MSKLSPDARLPVGEYKLADGRVFVGMDDAELQAFARADWRRQQAVDLLLVDKLSAVARPSPVRERPRFVTGDLFSGPPGTGD